MKKNKIFFAFTILVTLLLNIFLPLKHVNATNNDDVEKNPTKNSVDITTFINSSLEFLKVVKNDGSEEYIIKDNIQIEPQPIIKKGDKL